MISELRVCPSVLSIPSILFIFFLSCSTNPPSSSSSSYFISPPQSDTNENHFHNSSCRINLTSQTNPNSQFLPLQLSNSFRVPNKTALPTSLPRFRLTLLPSSSVISSHGISTSHQETKKGKRVKSRMHDNPLNHHSNLGNCGSPTSVSE